MRAAPVLLGAAALASGGGVAVAIGARLHADTAPALAATTAADGAVPVGPRLHAMTMPSLGAVTPVAGRSASITDQTVIPTTLVVAPGTPVAWTNVGRGRHTITADDGAFDSGSLTFDQTFRLDAPAASGAHPYHCRFHSYIRGTLIVSDLDLRGPDAVTFGQAAALHGTVPSVPAGTQVAVERRVGSVWQTAVSTVTAADGSFHASLPALTGGAVVRAVAGERLSPAVRMGVRAAVTTRRRGRVLRVRVLPAGPGTTARLERLDLDTYRWRAVRPVRLDGHARGSVALPRGGIYRVVVVRAPGGISGGASRAART